MKNNCIFNHFPTYAVGLVLVVVGSFCFSASSSDIGSSTAYFLKLPVGARATSIGEAFSSVGEDASVMFYNPAKLNDLKSVSSNLTGVLWLGEINYQVFSIAKKTNIGSFGLGIKHLSYGSLKELDISGNEKSNFSPEDYMMSISYANKIYDFAFGVNLKYINLKILRSANAYVLDFGLSKYFFNDKLNVGLGLENFGTKIKFNEKEEKLPENYKLSLAYFVYKKIILSSEINVPNDNEINYCFGLERAQKISEVLEVAGRVGYNTKAKEIYGTNGLSLGLGIKYFNISIDYAFSFYGDIGNTHLFSLSFEF